MSVVAGLVACAASSFSFGSMYVAVRIAGDPGDGIVVQWIVCSAIFLSGLVTYIATGAPPFQPFAMLGGFLWAIAMLLPFRSPNMNYLGLVLVIVGGILFAFVRPKPAKVPEAEQPEPGSSSVAMRREVLAQAGSAEEGESLMEGEGERVALELEGDGISSPARNGGSATEQRAAATRRRIWAIIFAVLAGVCYGSTFTPVIYMQDNPERFHNPPKDAIYYVFSHFTGIYLTSTAVLLLYIAYKQNNPVFDNRLILPSLLAGVLWAVAMLAWFVANDILSQAITFPINAMSPGVIASLWSVLYFNEIERGDLKLLAVAMAVTIFGVTLVGLSKTF